MTWIPIVAVAIATYSDWRFRRIPNWLTYSLIAISLPLFDLITLLILTSAILTALIFGARIGAGDIKLAAGIGIWSHILSWSQMWIYTGLLLGGVYGIFQRKSRIPFAPFIAAGVLLSNVARANGFI